MKPRMAIIGLLLMLFLPMAFFLPNPVHAHTLQDEALS
jgi:hypothetical protein